MVSRPLPGYRANHGDHRRRELASLHRTRLDTFRHAPDDALAVHLARTTELEEEYLTRYPEREIDPSRLTITSRS